MIVSRSSRNVIHHSNHANQQISQTMKSVTRMTIISSEIMQSTEIVGKMSEITQFSVDC